MAKEYCGDCAYYVPGGREYDCDALGKKAIHRHVCPLAAPCSLFKKGQKCRNMGKG